jgi:8-oxo-dGTP diphosphatase
MSVPISKARIVVGVGAVVWNGRGEVLLVRRANPPRQHEWSLPGGKVEFGETLHSAVAREVLEETGIAIEVLGLVDVAELVDQHHYILVDFAARARAGRRSANSDATEARWFAPDQIVELPLWSETRRIIALSAKTHNVAETTSPPT